MTTSRRAWLMVCPFQATAFPSGARGSDGAAGMGELDGELDFHDEPVVRALGDGLVAMSEHLRAEVRQDDPARTDGVEVTGQGRVVQVIADAALERVSLAYEEIDASRGIHQALAPLGVPRVDDRAPCPLDAQGIGRRAALVLDWEPGDREGAERGGGARLELDEIGLESTRHPGRAREQHLHRCRQPLPSARRAGDGEERLAPRELAVEDEEGEPAEVVAVQMREEDAADGDGIDAGRLERDERCRAAVDEDAAVLRPLEAEAGLEEAAGAEGVGGAEDAEPEPGQITHRERATEWRPSCIEGSTQ